MTTDSWQDLLSTALVGTRRRPLPPVTDTGPLGAVLHGITETDPAPALLDRAAVHTCYRRSGALAGVADRVAPAAPVEHRPGVPAAAAQRLAGLLTGSGDRGLAAEWLTLANDRDLAAPAQLLPDLLDLGRQRPELREAILRAGGARAGWLAALRPEWSAITEAAQAHDVGDDPTVWHEGGIAERVAYLSELRRRDPEAGLALLTEAWPDEAHTERAKLIEALRIGLSLADEALLEPALDDRRKEIRDRAGELLAGLAGSALGARMAERARQLVRVHQRNLRGDVLLVEPPTECDKSMRRDGIPAKPPQGVGERAFWLVEVLARTPLTTWPAPEALLGMAVAGDFRAELCRGLARAAISQGATAWAGPLIDAYATTTNPPIEDRIVLEELFAFLPPEERTTRARAAFGGSTPIGPVRALALAPVPWADNLSDLVLGHIALQVPKHRYSSRVSELCHFAESGLRPQRAAEVRELAAKLAEKHPDHHGVTDLRRLAATLTQRHDMQKEFA